MEEFANLHKAASGGELARDVAWKLLEAQAERNQMTELPKAINSFDFPLVSGT